MQNDCVHIRVDMPSSVLKKDKYGREVPSNILRFENYNKQLEVGTFRNICGL